MTHDYNALAMEYRTCTNRQRKNEIFTIIFNKYKPRIMKIASTFPKQDKDNYLSEVNVAILTAISKWKGDSSFTTYLYTALRAGLTYQLRQHDKFYDKKHYHILSDNLADFDYEGVKEHFAMTDWEYAKPSATH